MSGSAEKSSIFIFCPVQAAAEREYKDGGDLKLELAYEHNSVPANGLFYAAGIRWAGDLTSDQAIFQQFEKINPLWHYQWLPISKSSSAADDHRRPSPTAPSSRLPVEGWFYTSDPQAAWLGFAHFACE